MKKTFDKMETDNVYDQINSGEIGRYQFYDFRKVFCSRFHLLREERKMSQDAFAKFLGLSRPTVGFYENADKENGRIPDAETLSLICQKCGVSSDYLLGLVDDQSPKENIREVIHYTGLSERAIDYFHKLKITAPWNDDELKLISDLFSDDRMKDFIPLLVRYVGLLSQLTNASFSMSAEFTAIKDELEFNGYVISMPDDQANALFSERIVNLLRTMLNDIAEERSERLLKFVKKTGAALQKTEEEDNGIDPTN